MDLRINVHVPRIERIPADAAHIRNDQKSERLHIRRNSTQGVDD